VNGVCALETTDQQTKVSSAIPRVRITNFIFDPAFFYSLKRGF
jgi:hypothetical protein